MFALLRLWTWRIWPSISLLDRPPGNRELGQARLLERGRPCSRRIKLRWRTSLKSLTITDFR